MTPASHAGGRQFDPASGYFYSANSCSFTRVLSRLSGLVLSWFSLTSNRDLGGFPKEVGGERLEVRGWR